MIRMKVLIPANSMSLLLFLPFSVVPPPRSIPDSTVFCSSSVFRVSIPPIRTTVKAHSSIRIVVTSVPAVWNNPSSWRSQMDVFPIFRLLPTPGPFLGFIFSSIPSALEPRIDVSHLLQINIGFTGHRTIEEEKKQVGFKA